MNISGRVTVICIAYNHGEWIEQTLESVRLQDYPMKDLIVVDNGSKDDTAAKIRNWVDVSSGNLLVQTIFNREMQPYCQLFNQILATVEGQYLVDLSGDDVLYSDHLSKSISELQIDSSAAFVFSDAHILDESDEVRSFYKRDLVGNLVDDIEVSNIYVKLIRQSYVLSPTVVFNVAILRNEGGYDESLFYEDFDILVRLARNHPAVFSDHIGVLKRKHSQSVSAHQYLPHRSKMLSSTVRVCAKILNMNITEEENQALQVRILFELKHALWSANFGPARDLVGLGESLGINSLLFRIYKIWAKRGWDISWLYLHLK